MNNQITSENKNYGRSAQSNNILAAKLVSETIRTTLGPKGMDKMIVDSTGEIIVTNDGVTILEEMQIEHPAAKMIVEIAKTQESEIGDGTTTAVILAGELLKQAEILLEQNIHPTIIAKGYRLSMQKAIEILNENSKNVTINDEEILIKIAETAMTGKGAESSKEVLAKIAVEAVKNAKTLENIKIEKKTGDSPENSKLIKGIILDKEKVHPNMPDSLNNLKIALLNVGLEIKNTEVDSKITITDPEKLEQFFDMEEKMIEKMVEKIASTGANVIISQKGIDELAQHYLAKKNIFAVRRIRKSDMEKLSKATNGRIINNIQDLKESDLGISGKLEHKKIGDEFMTIISDAPNPKSVSILIRGSTEHSSDEIKRAMEDALGDLITALKNGKVISGAGSSEIELARTLEKYAESFSGREQLAVKAFSKAMEIIPRTLAENSGLDPIDVITELKARHDSNEKETGINVFTGKPMNAWKEGIIEPLKIKTQAITSAIEVAIMILRIDDVIVNSQEKPNREMH